LKPIQITAVHHAIGKHVASLIEDGSTLQLGIGGIPDAVLLELANHRDLGVQTEMLSDSAIPLIESGVLNGSRKTIHRGKIILSFVLGSKKLFDYVNNNPMFEFHPNKYTNDPWVVSQNSKMVAINSALQVDITGQVCADSIGTYFYSGIGGQVDFIRGASQSKGGKPIIAIPSTAKDNTISRIVPMLDPGAGVVTSRGAVHYVVTEFGVAYLHGRTIRQRAEALIQVAHPKFRDELYAYCEKTRWLQRPALQEK
jgi:acyl-CoA hydrolase